MPTTAQRGGTIAIVRLVPNANQDYLDFAWMDMGVFRRTIKPRPDRNMLLLHAERNTLMAVNVDTGHCTVREVNRDIDALFALDYNDDGGFRFVTGTQNEPNICVWEIDV